MLLNYEQLLIQKCVYCLISENCQFLTGEYKNRRVILCVSLIMNNSKISFIFANYNINKLVGNNYE